MCALHTDAAAASVTAAQGANALPLGSDIHFAPGSFAPHRSDGARRLTHELVHVLQQRGRTGDAAGKVGSSSAAEAGARSLGVAAAAGARVQVRQRVPAQLQAEDGPTDSSAGATPQLQLDPEIELLMPQQPAAPVHRDSGRYCPTCRCLPGGLRLCRRTRLSSSRMSVPWSAPSVRVPRRSILATAMRR